MRALRLLRTATAGAALSLIALAAIAADYPAPKEGDWTIKDFTFHTGDVLPSCACTTLRSGIRRESRWSSCTAPPARPPAC